MINLHAPTRRPDACRRRMRLPFEVERVLLTVTSRQGKQVNFEVTPRNISTEGLAVLHGQYLYEGSACIVVLPMLDGRMARLGGRIVNCRYICGRVHEVSIHFNEPIELQHFVPLSEQQTDRARREYALVREGH